MSRRNTLIAMLALGISAGPCLARAQTSARVPTIGFLSLGVAPASAAQDRTPIAAGLKAMGSEEGRSLRIERAYGDASARGTMQRQSACKTASPLKLHAVELFFPGDVHGRESLGLMSRHEICVHTCGRDATKALVGTEVELGP